MLASASREPACDIMLRMSLHELHPFCYAELQKLPRRRGVYVLFQIETPIHAAGASDLRGALLAARANFPQASHFSTETVKAGARALTQKVSKLRKELRLVRAAGFALPRP
jgi:hypothetical protein